MKCSLKCSLKWRPKCGEEAREGKAGVPKATQKTKRCKHVRVAQNAGAQAHIHTHARRARKTNGCLQGNFVLGRAGGSYEKKPVGLRNVKENCFACESRGGVLGKAALEKHTCTHRSQCQDMRDTSRRVSRKGKQEAVKTNKCFRNSSKLLLRRKWFQKWPFRKALVNPSTWDSIMRPSTSFKRKKTRISTDLMKWRGWSAHEWMNICFGCSRVCFAPRILF